MQSLSLAVLLLSAAGRAPPEGIMENGAVIRWLCLGPFNSGMGCSPTPAEMRRDFLTDGVIVGDLWRPQAGDEVQSDCGGYAACLAYDCVQAAQADPALDCVGGDAIPRVVLWESPSPDGFVILDDTWGPGSGDPPGSFTDLSQTVMGYAWAYVRNVTGGPLRILIGHSSDDSYRLLLNHREVPNTLDVVCRPADFGLSDQEILGPLTLAPGLNVFMTEVWEGGGAWNFRIRLLDAETRRPLRSPDEVVIEDGPEGLPPDAVIALREIPGDVRPGQPAIINIHVEVAIPPVFEAEVRERVPYLWHARNPSPPGKVETDEHGRETVVWKLSGSQVAGTLSYVLDVPSPYADVSFWNSTVIADGREHVIAGDWGFTGGVQANLRQVLIFPLLQPLPGCEADQPGLAAQALDYLTDGEELRETTVAPSEGGRLYPDFGGASPSPGPASGNYAWVRLQAQGPLPNAVSTGNDPGGWFNLPPCGSCLTYLASYAVNPFAETLRVRLGLWASGGEQVLLDGKEIWNSSAPKQSCCIPNIDEHTGVFDLSPGKHLLLFKAFHGCSWYNASLRFEDEDYNPLLVIQHNLDPAGYPARSAFVLRDIPESLDADETATVTLRLRVLEPLRDGIIEENVPGGFTISEVSPPGVRQGQRITWTLAGELSNRSLSYRVTVPESALDAAFEGRAVLGGVEREIVGDRGFERGVMSSAGFIRRWLVLGPLETRGLWPGDPANPPGNPDAPGAAPERGDLRLDYLTDGALTEKTIRPFEGMRIAPRFGGNGVTGAKSLGLEQHSGPCVPPSPTWEAYLTRTGTFFHNDYFGGEVDSHLTYAACYLRNTTGGPITGSLAYSSDDAFIAYLNGQEIGAFEPVPCSSSACGRGYGPEDEVQDRKPVTLPPGESFLLVRVHDGVGASGFRLRFEDSQGRPLLPPALEVSIRSVVSPPPATVERLLLRESYRLADPLTVRLSVEVAGTHTVSIREVLPQGFEAGAISDGGFLNGDRIEWTLSGLSASRKVSYQLFPPPCGGGGTFCGSTFTVDGASVHAVGRENSFRRERSAAEDLGPWDARDLGFTGGGVERVREDGIDVVGLGGGVKSTSDEYRFISVILSGDFEVSTCIGCVDDPGGTGQGGIMVRDTFDGFAANAFYYLSTLKPAGGGAGTLRASLRRATKPGQSSAVISITDNDVASLPVCLKLSRKGAALYFYRSRDGVNWSEVARKGIGAGATEINLREETLVGFAVSGGGGGSARFGFRDVRGVPSFAESRPAFRRGDTDASGELDLSDAVGILNYLFLGSGNPACLDAADVDDDGVADITDAITLLSFQFLGGSPPADPGPYQCGPDPKDEDPELGCEQPCP